MTAATRCRTCGAEPRESARLCDACGSPITRSHEPAEYKQVTMLFANVVRSMDIASTMVAERLCDIMTELVNRGASVVRRYGDTPLG